MRICKINCPLQVMLLCFLFSPIVRAQSSKGIPVYQITPVQSKVDFSVEASIALEGTFEKWNATLKFTSDDVSTGVLDVKIDAASANTGSHIKDDKARVSRAHRYRLQEAV